MITVHWSQQCPLCKSEQLECKYPTQHYQFLQYECLGCGYIFTKTSVPQFGEGEVTNG